MNYPKVSVIISKPKNIMYRFDNNIIIRKLYPGDEGRLLQFFLSLSPESARFYNPWPFTPQAIAEHARRTFENMNISFVAIDATEKIVGHAFINQARNRPSSGVMKFCQLLGIIRSKFVARKISKQYLSHNHKISIKKSPLSYLTGNRPSFGIGLREEVQGMGLGTAMMKLALEEAKRLEVPSIFIGVQRENIKAIRLYEKMGFVTFGEYTDREPNDSWKMELIL